MIAIYIKHFRTGVNKKAKKEEAINNKIDRKQSMKINGQLQAQRFIKKVNSQKGFIDLARPADMPKRKFESDTSLSGIDKADEYNLLLSTLEQKHPKIKPHPYTHRPKIIDFTKNINELNANQYDEDGNQFFTLKSSYGDIPDENSSSNIQKSKLRSHFNEKLWMHMTDFKHDGENKIQTIRRKYRNLISPGSSNKHSSSRNDYSRFNNTTNDFTMPKQYRTLTPNENDAAEIYQKSVIDENSDNARSLIKQKYNHAARFSNFTQKRSSSDLPIIFIKRDHNDKYRYEQMKEINTLKDRLASDGVAIDTNVLRRAILMPEDIK